MQERRARQRGQVFDAVHHRLGGQLDEVQPHDVLRPIVLVRIERVGRATVGAYRGVGVDLLRPAEVARARPGAVDLGEADRVRVRAVGEPRADRVPHRLKPLAPGAAWREEQHHRAGVLLGEPLKVRHRARKRRLVKLNRWRFARGPWRQADLVALAREFLRDPHWTLRAAKALRSTSSVPDQYGRAMSFG